MVNSNIINYPPKEILEPPSKISKPNFELIILWMLNNNESCSGSNFLEIKNLESDTVFSKSTLYNYLKNLIEDGYINKSAYNKYQITSNGRDRFYELSRPFCLKHSPVFPLTDFLSPRLNGRM